MNENTKRYPHEEKVWEKYYDKSRDKFANTRKTIYRNVKDNNVYFPNDIALQYFGKKIDFRNMEKNITSTSKAFSYFDIGYSKNIALCLPGMPELVYSFYTCSKIGAVGTLISPFLEPKDFINKLSDGECETLVIMDNFYPNLKSAIKDASFIKNVVIVPTFNSSALSFIPSSYKREKGSNELYWNDFIRCGKNWEEPLEVEYEADKPLSVVYSSGTTNVPKGIVLSNDSFYNTAKVYPEVGVDITRRQVFYQIIPPWASTGINVCINLPLTYGVTVFMDPRFQRDVFVKNILKQKPAFAVATTSMYEGFLDEKLIKSSTDLSFLKYPFEGGEPLRKSLSDKINNVFKEHGAQTKLLVGYGQCECGATITTQIHGHDHTEGSVGIPLPGVVVGIADENKNFLPYNIRGEILVNTQNGMLEYYKRPEATDKYFYVDENNIKWSCTGDIGYMNDNGELFVLGRADDYTIIDDHKVYNFDVEDVILTFSEISNVDVLSKINDDNTNSIVAHIILEPHYKEDVESGKRDIGELFDAIQEKSLEKLGEEGVTKNFMIWDSFPFAKSGKRNTPYMQNKKDGLIYHSSYLRKKQI